MVLGKRPKYQQTQILDHLILFIIRNVVSGYRICHLENWFFHLYVSLKSFHRRTSEAVVHRCSSKQVFLKISQISSTGEHLCWSLLLLKLLKLQALAFNFIKKVSVNGNIEKSTTVNSEGLKRGTKRLNMKNTQTFHITQPFQQVFGSPNSIIKKKKHFAKYVQSKTKNKLFKTKFVKLNFYKCVNFLLF